MSNLGELARVYLPNLAIRQVFNSANLPVFGNLPVPEITQTEWRCRSMYKHCMRHAGITIVFITYIPRGHVGLLLPG